MTITPTSPRVSTPDGASFMMTGRPPGPVRRTGLSPSRTAPSPTIQPVSRGTLFSGLMAASLTAAVPKLRGSTSSMPAAVDGAYSDGVAGSSYGPMCCGRRNRCRGSEKIDLSLARRSASPCHRLFVQCEPQCPKGVVQPRLHGSFSNLQVVGDLCRRQPQVVRASNHGAVLGRQLCHRVDQHPIQRRVHLIGACVRGRVQRGRPTT